MEKQLRNFGFASACGSPSAMVCRPATAKGNNATANERSTVQHHDSSGTASSQALGQGGGLSPALVNADLEALLVREVSSSARLGALQEGELVIGGRV